MSQYVRMIFSLDGSYLWAWTDIELGRFVLAFGLHAMMRKIFVIAGLLYLNAWFGFKVWLLSNEINFGCVGGFIAFTLCIHFLYSFLFNCILFVWIKSESTQYHHSERWLVIRSLFVKIVLVYLRLKCTVCIFYFLFHLWLAIENRHSLLLLFALYYLLALWIY